jgi:hypothetical protein
MNRIATARTRLLAVFLAPACAAAIGTACGAQDPASTTTMFQPTQATKSPEVEAAEKRMTAAKDRLDQARQQFSTAKAMVKAAEAELKASKADRDALALRQTATQLADASGFVAPANVQPVGGGVIMPTNGGNRLTPVATTPAMQAQQGSMPASTLGPAAAPTSPVDFNGTPMNDGGDLRPNQAAEPNPVP